MCPLTKSQLLLAMQITRRPHIFHAKQPLQYSKKGQYGGRAYCSQKGATKIKIKIKVRVKIKIKVKVKIKIKIKKKKLMRRRPHLGGEISVYIEQLFLPFIQPGVLFSIFFLFFLPSSPWISCPNFSDQPILNKPFYRWSMN